MQKTFVLSALLAVMALPLAGCSNTWNGMKSDMSSMADSVSGSASANTAPGQPITITPDNGPASYNN
jgi:predicted small secreted protein